MSIRPVKFNKEILNDQYRHIMLINGNDERGINVGLMTKAGFPMKRITSNVDLDDSVGQVFSRDCPQFEVTTPNGGTIHVLVNHLKSQSGGGGSKRERQAIAIRTIADQLTSAGEHVVVMGDLNEGPRAVDRTVENVSRLYTDNSPLVECYSLPQF